MMRMLCLVSLLYGGIKKHDHYKNELLQVYGYEHMFAISSLEKVLSPSAFSSSALFLP